MPPTIITIFACLLASAVLHCGAATDASRSAPPTATAVATAVEVPTDPADFDFSRTGARLLPEELYLKVQQAKMARNFSSADAELYSALPARVDLAEELPQAGEQGRQGSCSGWAVGYAVKSFHENREHGWGLTPDHLFSPAFIYNQVNAGVDEGAYMTDVLGLLETAGTVPLSMMPYRTSDFTTQPSEELKNLARSFRSLGYRRLDDSDVLTVKSYLAAGDPVVLEIALYKNFAARGLRKSGNVYRDKEGELMGYHFLVAVGYDDAKSAVKILNSWGKRWGENGLAWIAYDFFPTAVERSYVVYDIPTPKPAVALLWREDGGKPLQSDAPLLAADSPAPDSAGARVAINTPPDSAQSKAAAAVLPNDETLLIVPEEAGATCNDRWLRLGEELATGRDFFSEATSARFTGFDPNLDDATVGPHYLYPDKVGQMNFLSDKRVPVYTNLGVTFHSPRKEVQRIYRKPDHVDSDGRGDTYFYHALPSEWGGVTVISHAALTFHYDGNDAVDRMTLASVFKESALGTASKTVVPALTAGGTGGSLIDAPEAGIRFEVPKGFTEVAKSAWPGIGHGFFMTPPGDTLDRLTVKIYDLPGKGEEVLAERMDAELKSQQATTGPLQNVSLGGANWRLAEESSPGHRRFYFAFKNGRVYEIFVFSDDAPAAEPWIRTFLESVRIVD